MRTALDGTLVTCDKHAYSKKEAQTVINVAKTNKGHSRRRKGVESLRAYPRNRCAHWHISSKAKYET